MATPSASASRTELAVRAELAAMAKATASSVSVNSRRVERLIADLRAELALAKAELVRLKAQAAAPRTQRDDEGDSVQRCVRMVACVTRLQAMVRGWRARQRLQPPSPSGVAPLPPVESASRRKGSVLRAAVRSIGDRRRNSFSNSFKQIVAMSQDQMRILKTSTSQFEELRDSIRDGLRMTMTQREGTTKSLQAALAVSLKSITAAQEVLGALKKKEAITNRGAQRSHFTRRSDRSVHSVLRAHHHACVCIACVLQAPT